MVNTNGAKAEIMGQRLSGIVWKRHMTWAVESHNRMRYVSSLEETHGI